MFKLTGYPSRLYAMTLAFCLLGLGCSDDAEPAPTAGPSAVDGGGDTNEDASAPECVLALGGTCPEGCSPVHGQPWDEANECWHQAVLMGCTPTGYDDMPAEGCYVHIDSGTIYRTANLYSLGSSFRECTEEEPLVDQELAQACD